MGPVETAAVASDGARREVIEGLEKAAIDLWRSGFFSRASATTLGLIAALWRLQVSQQRVRLASGAVERMVVRFMTWFMHSSQQRSSCVLDEQTVDAGVLPNRINLDISTLLEDYSNALGTGGQDSVSLGIANHRGQCCNFFNPVSLDTLDSSSHSYKHSFLHHNFT